MTPEIIIGDASEFARKNLDAWPCFVRIMHFKKAGDQEPEHKHNEGHFTFMLKGRAMFLIEGEMKEKAAPCLVWIPGDTMHQITALEDDVWAACIHDRRAFTAADNG